MGQARQNPTQHLPGKRYSNACEASECRTGAAGHCSWSENFLFAGSNCGGERAAAMYTLIGSAKLNGINPELYIRTVLAQIADHAISHIQELLPWNLAASLRAHSSHVA